MYKILVLVEPTQTTSNTSESNGASVTLPLATSKMYHAVEDSWAVQLYVADEKRANSYRALALACWLLSAMLTPLGLTIAVLLLGAASIPLSASASQLGLLMSQYELNGNSLC